MPATVTSQPPRPPSSRRLPLPLRVAPVLVGAILAFTVAVTVIASGATLSAPSKANPGSTIMVTGHGLPPRQSGSLTYDGAKITKFSTSASGWFSVPFTIPGYTPIGHVGRISAKEADGDVLATTTLVIGSGDGTQASISVPAQAELGTTITVAGSDFAAGLPGYLTLDGLSLAPFVAGGDGSFSVQFPIPSTARVGTDRITARIDSDFLDCDDDAARGHFARPRRAAPAR